MMSVVIIPAYRPDETLAQLAGRLWLYGCRIVVVDDGSGEAKSGSSARSCVTRKTEEKARRSRPRCRISGRTFRTAM